MGEQDAVQRELEQDVLAFNRQLAEAMACGRDVGRVIDELDPDPLRYIWAGEGGGELPAMLAAGRQALAGAPLIDGHVRGSSRAVHGGDSAARPAVACRDDGAVLTAWIEWEPDVGERVVASLTAADGEEIVPATRLFDEPTDCFRPSAAFDAHGTAWVLYGAATDGQVGVWARCLDGDRWGPPELVSTTEHPSFNQEAALRADGALEVCWQGRLDDRFGIFARRRENGAWGPTTLISGEDGDNAWDPAIAALPDGGTAYAWSAYHEGAYRVLVRAREDSPARPVSAGTDYGVHPSLAATADGSLWCAFDLIAVHGHSGSGPTQLVPADRLDSPPPSVMREAGKYIPPELRPHVESRIAVVRVTDDGVADAPGELAPGLEVNPGGLPRLAAGKDGGLVVAYRVMRRLPMLHYHWEVAAQALGSDGWGPPTTFAGSDAGHEEPAVAAGADGAVVTWQTDGRRERSLEWTDGFGGHEQARLREHYGEVVWHGIHAEGHVRAGIVGLAAGPTPRPVATRPVLEASSREEARPWASHERERHHADVDGKRMTLYWGDLHRHSLISRCTAGDDPSIEDFYRYAWDVSEYDFWAVTDHSENTTAYQWWGIQKIADLFRVDGRFVPLYGFEWTSWMGHQNVIFGDVERGAPIFSAEAERTNNPAKLWAHLRQHPDYPAVTIPHHPGAVMVPYDWDYYDEDYLRIVEVFQSCRGNYEDDGCFRQYSDGTLKGTFTLDGLRRGHRFGLVASSDHGNGASYVGAYAEDLDRESLFDALWSRRTVAATTRGIAVDFRANGAFMGSEITADGPVELACWVSAYRDVARVDLVRNGEVVASRVPDLALPEGWVAVPLRVEWGLCDADTDWSGTLRVDGGAVLETPFYGPEFREADRSGVRWEASTHSLGGGGLYESQRGGVEVTVLGPPDAEVRVDTAGGVAKATLGEIRGGAVDGTVTGTGRLRLQPGVGGLTSLGGRSAELRATDDPGGEPAWYYARAFLVDGEMAWSSPVWVDPARRWA